MSRGLRQCRHPSTHAHASDSSGGCWAGAWLHTAVATVVAAVEAEATAVGAVAAGWAGLCLRTVPSPAVVGQFASAGVIYTNDSPA